MKMLLLELRHCNKDGEEEPFLQRCGALNRLAEWPEDPPVTALPVRGTCQGKCRHCSALAAALRTIGNHMDCT